MKRAVLSAVFLAALGALGGCPIYSHDDDGCWRDRDCAYGYLCDDSSGVCYLPGSDNGRCGRPSDCGVNQTCSSSGLCVSGDCSFSGCVSGYRCDGSGPSWQCVSSTGGSSNGDAGGGSAGGASGATQSAGAGEAGADSSAAAGVGGDAALASGVGTAGEAGGG
ncbi:MAG: hypothetical protein ABUL62_29290 [Myxococcales bacterium]